MVIFGCKNGETLSTKYIFGVWRSHCHIEWLSKFTIVFSLQNNKRNHTKLITVKVVVRRFNNFSVTWNCTRPYFAMWLCLLTLQRRLGTKLSGIDSSLPGALIQHSPRAQMMKMKENTQAPNAAQIVNLLSSQINNSNNMPAEIPPIFPYDPGRWHSRL